MSGDVYFALGGKKSARKNQIKVGYTRGYLKERLRNLTYIEDCAPLTLIGSIETNVPRRLERELHSILQRYRSSKEWFYYRPQVKNFIIELLGQNGK